MCCIHISSSKGFYVRCHDEIYFKYTEVSTISLDFEVGFLTVSYIYLGSHSFNIRLEYSIVCCGFSKLLSCFIQLLKKRTILHIELINLQKRTQIQQCLLQFNIIKDGLDDEHVTCISNSCCCACLLFLDRRADNLFETILKYTHMTHHQSSVQ